MRIAALLATALPFAALTASPITAQTGSARMSRPAITYPQTARETIVEPQFGVQVADPYRWLENDVRNDNRVREWVTAQNQVTDTFLTQLPHRDAFRQRMRQLYDFERFSVPEKAGNRYFYTRNDGLQNQSVLYVREGLNGTPRLLIDPNAWSQDQATALAEWEVSPDGRYVAYGVQEGGSDWRTIRVLDVATGQSDILQPNRSIADGYELWIAELTDGSTTSGVIAAETPTSVTFRHAGGSAATIARARIAAMRIAPVSAMPEGLGASIDVQQMADLIAFIKGGP